VDLLARTRLVETELADFFSTNAHGNLKDLCPNLSNSSGTRITFISNSGTVLCDSEGTPKSMDNHASRPEIALALKGSAGNSIRFSDTLHQEMIYTAIPFYQNGTLKGALRAAMPIRSINEALKGAYADIALGGLVAALIAAALGLLVSRRISRPLVELKKGAELFSKGNLDDTLPVSDSQEIGTLAETLNQMAAQLKKLEAIRRDFVANVSHELKTPITSIRGFVETLLDGNTEGPKETEKFLKITLKQVDRLNAIIEDLLSLSRIEQESENSSISLESILIENIVTAATQSCETKAAEKNIRLGCFSQGGIIAKVNPILLEQAIVNLIDNAIKYSDAGSIISIRAVAMDGEVAINVRDQGIGIAPEHLQRIFERFYRVDKARSRKHGGTGLGLAIVKHIAAAHGGRVWAESTPREGSTFTMCIPIEIA
jgi:signal transduction histidine kinase